MNNDNNTRLKKGFALKIIIPVLLIGVVVGIWVVKNEQNNTVLAGADKPISDSIEKTSSDESSIPSVSTSSIIQEETTKNSNVSAEPTNKLSVADETKDSAATTVKLNEGASDKVATETTKKNNTASTNKTQKAEPQKPITSSEKANENTSEEASLASTDNPNKAESDSLDFALHVTEKIDLEKLKSYRLPIVIDFGADSCIPCKQMAPVLKELNEELQGKAIIKFVDVWKYRDLAEGYPISLIPTQILIDANGKPYSPENPEAMQLKLYSTKDTGEHVFTAHEGGLTKEQLLSMLKEMGLKG